MRVHATGDHLILDFDTDLEIDQLGRVFNTSVICHAFRVRLGEEWETGADSPSRFRQVLGRMLEIHPNDFNPIL
jgi:hypothetical protein